MNDVTTHIDLTNMLSHFFPPKQKQTSQSPHIHHKIVNYSHFSINETNLCHKVKHISNYRAFFSLLKDHEALNLAHLSEGALERLPLEEGQTYYLFTYEDKDAMDIIQVLYGSPTIQMLLPRMLGALQHLLFGLRLLNKHGVCFFDISPHNIVYLATYREKPVLRNFKFGINLAHLDYTHLSHVLRKLKSFTYQPLEIHLLYYFVTHKMVTISHSFIEEFCEEFMESKQNVLRLCSAQFRERYREQCIATLSKYINRPRKEIIEDILERSDKWDVYGISVLFFHIFACIARVFSLKGNFVSKLTAELANNLHPDSDKRRSLEDTLVAVQLLIHETPEWSWVSGLDNELLPSLFEELAS